MGYRDFDKSTGELSFWKNSSKKNETSVSRGLDYLELLITNSYGHAFDEKFRQAVLDLGAAVKYARSDKNKLYYRTPGSLKDFANGLARCGRVEHIVPVSVIVNKIRNVPLLDDGRIDRFAILFLFSKYYYLCAVSLEEDALLNKKLSSKMPDDWDDEDIFARYRAVGITVLEGSGHIAQAKRIA